MLALKKQMPLMRCSWSSKKPTKKWRIWRASWEAWSQSILNRVKLWAKMKSIQTVSTLLWPAYNKNWDLWRIRTKKWLKPWGKWKEHLKIKLIEWLDLKGRIGNWSLKSFNWRKTRTKIKSQECNTLHQEITYHNHPIHLAPFRGTLWAISFLMIWIPELRNLHKKHRKINMKLFWKTRIIKCLHSCKKWQKRLNIYPRKIPKTKSCCKCRRKCLINMFSNRIFRSSNKRLRLKKKIKSCACRHSRSKIWWPQEPIFKETKL